MANIWLAFLTGLTTGGLSCMAVQGGLLATSLAQQVEQDMAARSRKRRKQKRIAHPILLFLVAKLAAYTLLGFLLGAVGSILQPNAVVRAVLQIAIGLFMVGNALRLFNVHPIFRYFAFQPPSFVNRYVRRVAKRDNISVTPLFLGALTVLIPCGITQAMMAVAIGTGDPLQGAATMGAFTLGTGPVFFALAYLVTRLGATMEKHFTRIAAVVILILGLVAVETGLALMGSPFTVTNLARSLGQPEQTTATPVSPPAVGTTSTPSVDPSVASNMVTIQAKNGGYVPGTSHAPSGVPIQLNVVTNNTRSCSRAFVIPSLGIERILPVTGDTTIDIPAQAQGSVLRFSCSMGMYIGKIVFD